MPEILDNRFAIQDGNSRKGGFAVVKKATDINEGGFVAIKLLLGADDSILRRLFEREKELLSKAEHPNIVRYVDAGIDETDTPYIVLDWVEDNLSDVLDRAEPLAWAEFLVRVLRPLSDAVAYLHRQGVEHRDIKAINVLSDIAESPLLADFGIAKQHDDESTHTVANFGTKLWTPPEGSDAIPFTRDVFALGVMCIFGMTPNANRPKSFSDLSLRLAELDMPDGLRSLIGSAIDKDPNSRPRNAIEFLRRLDNVVAIQQPVPSKTRIYLGLTNAARKQLVGADGIPDQAERYLLQDLSGETWASSPWDNGKNQYDPTVVFITGMELKITAKRDRGRSSFAVTGVTRPDYDEIERSRDRGMRVTDFITWTTQQSPDGRALGVACDFLIERVHEFLSQRDEQAAELSGIAQVVKVWQRLLDAREALLSEETAELEFADYVDRSSNETQFTLLREPEADLIGTEWLILDDARSRNLMQGTVVHQAGIHLSIRWTWRRPGSLKIPRSCHRLRPHLGPTAVALSREREALQILEAGTAAIPELPKLLSDLESVRAPKPPLRVDWQADLDEGKQEAVKAALGLEDMMVVTGPPGTGKTRFIAETVFQFLATRPEAQVLIVSQTHVAVDNAIERLVGAGVKDIVRIGAADDVRISDQSRKLILENRVADWAKRIRQKSEQHFEATATAAGVNKNYLRAALALEQFDAQWRQIVDLEKALRVAENQEQTTSRLDLGSDPAELERKLRRLRAHLEDLLETARNLLGDEIHIEASPNPEDIRAAIDLIRERDPSSRSFASLLRLQGEWLQRLEADDAIADLYLQSSRVIAGTCLGFLRHRAVRNLRFDLCIIDEASKATSTEALVPAVRSRRVVLVGDENQLPPVDEGLITRKELLENFDLSSDFVRQTLFSRLVEGLPETNRFALVEQYRMIAPIGNLISECFYDGTLKSPLTSGVKGYEYLGKTVSWIDTSNDPNRFENHDTNYAGSYLNRLEANLVVQRLLSIDSALETGLLEPRGDGQPYDVLLIAPYRGQIDEISRRLSRKRIKNLVVEVESVDAVQGREADFVIFSVTRSNSARRFGFLGQDYWRRINVALSRAKFGLTIVGDATFSSDERGSLARVLTYMRRHPDECEIRGSRRVSN